MAYATTSDLHAYLSDDLELPREWELERMLARASELVDEATLGRVDPDNDDHAAAARMATLATVESWLDTGEEADVRGAIQSYQIGSLRINYGSSGGRSVPGTLTSRARRHLLLAGLLYRGVPSCG